MWGLLYLLHCIMHTWRRKSLGRLRTYPPLQGARRAKLALWVGEHQAKRDARRGGVLFAGRTRGNHWRCGGLAAIQWDEVFAVIACDVWSLKAFRSSSARKGLIRTETPCEEIETTVCDLMSPVITMAGTFRPSAARR
jgi:hypothetical protein